MAEEIPKPEELLQIDHRPPKTDWMETPINIRKGMYCYASNPKSVDYLGLPNARPWNSRNVWISFGPSRFLWTSA